MVKNKTKRINNTSNKNFKGLLQVGLFLLQDMVLLQLILFILKEQFEGSLKRLDTDYIDLYQMHWPDTVVPIEESLKAFDELVKEGKVRYIGTSNDSAYGLTKANEVSKYKDLTRFESIQNNFSLLNPRFHDELANVCRRESISLLPYSPIGGGVLSGKYNSGLYPEGCRFTAYAKT